LSLGFGLLVKIWKKKKIILFYFIFVFVSLGCCIQVIYYTLKSPSCL
jgi:hypothetical protein